MGAMFTVIKICISPTIANMEGLGVEMLQCLRLPHTITKKQQELKEMLDELDDQSLPQEFDDLTIFDQRPNFDDIDVSWIYGIDLDYNVFRANGVPFLLLEMPSRTRKISRTRCRLLQPSLCASVPPKYKYKRPTTPVVDDSDLKTSIFGLHRP